MATSAVSTAAAPATPLRTINRGNNFMRHGGSANRMSAAVSGKRKSAVELLQETKSLYVKSNTVLDRTQQLATVGGGAPLHHHHHQHHRSHRHGNGDKHSSGRDSASGAPMPPLKSPRLVNSGAVPHQRHGTLPPAAAVAHSGSSSSSSNQLQTKLRRLLNADSKENLLDVQDAAASCSLFRPPSSSTPTSPMSSVCGQSMASVILPPPRNFSSRCSSLSSQSQNSLRTTMAGTLKPGRNSRGSSDGDDKSLRSWSHHKSLPDLHRAASGQAGAAAAATTTSSSSDDNSDEAAASCRYALYSASSTDSGRSRHPCPSQRQRTSSGNSGNNNHHQSDADGAGYEAMSVCSARAERQRQCGARAQGGTSVGSWRSFSDEDSTSGGGSRDDDCDEGGDGRSNDDDDDDHNDGDVRYDGGDVVDMVFGSPVKSCASYSAAATSVRYNRIRCDTDWSSNAVDGASDEAVTPRDEDENELVFRWRPILRSKSDVGRRYARLSAATPVESPGTPTDLETFFEQLGLDTAEYSILVGDDNDSRRSSPIFFSDSSTVDSVELCAARQRSALSNSKPANTGEDAEPDHPVDLPSVVERNARIIKWLCNCRKAVAASAAAAGTPPGGQKPPQQQRHMTMS